MPIRQATLDDTQSISQLFRTRIDRWQRMDARNQVQDLPYDDLSIYERWLHGGAWMSVETGALWLNHLRGGAGIPWVLECDDHICAYVEAYISEEAAPFGTHCHLGEFVSRDADSFNDDLMQHILDDAPANRLTVSMTAYDTRSQDFYKRYGFQELQAVQQVQIPAQEGQVGFYKVVDHPGAKYDRIRGWQMPIGRTECARQHWEALWSPSLWQAVPAIQARKTHRQQFSVGGQDAFVCVQQHLYNPRAANIYCWTPKSLTSQLINAIRDWTHQQGYRTLTLNVHEKVATMLTGLEETPRQHIIYFRDRS